MDPLELPAALVRRAAAQGGVFTHLQAVQAGLEPAEIQRRRRAEQLVAVRRAVYATADDVAAADPHAAHLMAASARRLVTAGDVLVSHESAAMLFGCRLLGAAPEPARLTVARPPGSPPLHLHALHTAAVPPQDRHLLLPKVPVTSPARTVADCCRALPVDAALVVADAALGRGVSRAEVLAVLERCRRWPGAVGASDVVCFADARAESALESLARRWVEEQGMPRPELQLQVCELDTGLFVARVDFLWREHRTVLEVDGRLEYRDRDDVSPGDRLRDPLFAEKQREDRLRELGLEVVRGYWSDGDDRGRDLADRLRRAFARAAARADAPRYGIRTPRPAERTA